MSEVRISDSSSVMQFLGMRRAERAKEFRKKRREGRVARPNEVKQEANTLAAKSGSQIPVRSSLDMLSGSNLEASLRGKGRKRKARLNNPSGPKATSKTPVTTNARTAFAAITSTAGNYALKALPGAGHASTAVMVIDGLQQKAERMNDEARKEIAQNMGNSKKQHQDILESRLKRQGMR